MIEKVISYESFDNLEFGRQYYNITFLEDFGPWKKDQFIRVLSIDLKASEAVEFDFNNNQVASCKLRLETC